MDLENKVDSFVDHFLQIHSNIDEELLDYRNHGWVDDIKNFNTIFEEMANVSNDLYQNGHEWYYVVLFPLNSLTNSCKSSRII